MELPHVQAAQEEAARSLADMVRDKFRRRFPKWLFRCEIVTGPLLMPRLYGSRALERIEAQSIAARQRRLRAHVPIRATRAGYLSFRNEAGAGPLDKRLRSFETRFPQCIIM